MYFFSLNDCKCPPGAFTKNTLIAITSSLNREMKTHASRVIPDTTPAILFSCDESKIILLQPAARSVDPRFGRFVQGPHNLRLIDYAQNEFCCAKHWFSARPVRYVTLTSSYVTPKAHDNRTFVEQKRQNESDHSISRHFKTDPRKSQPPEKASGCSPRIRDREAREITGGSL